MLCSPFLAYSFMWADTNLNVKLYVVCSYNGQRTKLGRLHRPECQSNKEGARCCIPFGQEWMHYKCCQRSQDRFVIGVDHRDPPGQLVRLLLIGFLQLASSGGMVSVHLTWSLIAMIMALFNGSSPDSMRDTPGKSRWVLPGGQQQPSACATSSSVSPAASAHQWQDPAAATIAMSPPSQNPARDTASAAATACPTQAAGSTAVDALTAVASTTAQQRQASGSGAAAAPVQPGQASCSGTASASSQLEQVLDSGAASATEQPRQASAIGAASTPAQIGQAVGNRAFAAGTVAAAVRAANNPAEGLQQPRAPEPAAAPTARGTRTRPAAASARPDEPPIDLSGEPFVVWQWHV